MKALLLLVMQSGWSSAQVPRHRHTSSHSIVSFEEMHLETINADKGKQIDKALSHNHRKVHEGNNAEALTGKHSKPQYEPTKNKKELIERYLDAEPASNRQSFVSKGGTIHELGHPETLGVQVGGVQEPVDKKKSKFSDKDREDDIHNDEDEPPPPTNNDRTKAGLTVNARLLNSSRLTTRTVQDNIIGEGTVVIVTLEHAAFLYERAYSEAPSRLDLSRLAFVTNLVLLEMFQHVFANVISADYRYISMDISEYTALRDDFVNFKVNVYFNGEAELVPDVQQLSEIASEELSLGSKYYNLYLRWMQQNESPVLSSTRGFTFVASRAEIDRILGRPTAAPIDENNNSDTGINDSTTGTIEQEKTNHLIPLIILGLILLGTAAWFSHRRKIHARRPQRGHILMQMSGGRDETIGGILL